MGLDNTRRLVLVALLFVGGCEADRGPASSERHLPIAELVAEARPTGIKVILVGIDGGSFVVLKPMIKAGRLPGFQRLIDEGTHGMLLSEKPAASPAIWNTIATSRNRDAHGIVSFTTQGSNGIPRLVRSTDRKLSAIWNWLTPFDVTVGFQGWWASWPAERVSGWVVSDRLTRSRHGEWNDARHDGAVTFPHALAEELTPLIVDPMAPPEAEIAEMVELTEQEWVEFRAARQPLEGHWLSVFKFAFCSQRTYEKVALHMLAKGQPDLMGIFLIATDPISHTFWYFYQPHYFAGVDVAKAERLGALVEGIYEHNDRFISEVLARADPETVVIVVSDHGFQAAKELPEAYTREQYEERQERGLEVDPDLEAVFQKTGALAIGQSGMHRLDGMLIAQGGPIRKGHTVRGSIYDVAPTILALMGLPVPDDAEGQVLTEMFEPEFLEEHPIRRIASYDDYIDLSLVRPAVDEDELDDPELLERLRALGYIQ